MRHPVIDTNNDHINSHIESGHCGQNGQNGHNGRFGTVYYGHEYGHYWCLLKDQEKCRSPVKTVLKKLQRVKSYGRIKINSEIMAISFVFWANYSTGLRDPLKCSDLSEKNFGVYPYIK